MLRPVLTLGPYLLVELTTVPQYTHYSEEHKDEQSLVGSTVNGCHVRLTGIWQAQQWPNDRDITISPNNRTKNHHL